MKSANESRIYNLVLTTLYLEGNRTDDCIDTLNIIKDHRGFHPTPFMYSIVFKALHNQADWKRSTTLLLQIVLKTKRLRRYTYIHIYINTYRYIVFILTQTTILLVPMYIHGVYIRKGWMHSTCNPWKVCYSHVYERRST